MSADAGDALFARLLSDVMIPAELAEAIRIHGYDVIEARSLALEIQQDDEEILAEATRQQRAVLTCNYSDPSSNFCVIDQQWKSKEKEHAGIILVPQRQVSSRSKRWQVRDWLLKFLNHYTSDQLHNQIWWLPRE